MALTAAIDATPVLTHGFPTMCLDMRLDVCSDMSLAAGVDDVPPVPTKPKTFVISCADYDNEYDTAGRMMTNMLIPQEG